MDLSLFAVAAVAFVVGGLIVGGFAWLFASLRARSRLEPALREAESGRAAEAAKADALARSLGEQRALLDAAKGQLGDAFQALAADALRASQEDFLALAQERLGGIQNQARTELDAREKAQAKALEGMVAPVRASLDKVDEQIRAIERERGTAYGALRQQLATVAETQQRLHDATGSLVSALKAPSVRGRWGEIQLRRVVELAGMLEHCDFVEQHTLVGEEGRLRPDLIVHLPGGRSIVVDAKAPLGAYLEAREAPTEDARTAKLRHHAAQVHAHVGKLSAKSYWDELGVAPEMVVMFLPGESLYSVALEQMPGLIEDGVAQRVLIATPTTLIALLRAVSCGWREERLAKNAQRIAEEGRKLHERIATVVDHFADLGRALGQSVKHFNATMASFNQRVVVSARRLEQLDSAGKKVLDELDEIEVRPVTVAAPPAEEPPRRLGKSLTLALPTALSSAGGQND
jgi:DNA recombination protein RmuC